MAYHKGALATIEVCVCKFDWAGNLSQITHRNLQTSNVHESIVTKIDKCRRMPFSRVHIEADLNVIAWAKDTVAAPFVLRLGLTIHEGF